MDNVIQSLTKSPIFTKETFFDTISKNIGTSNESTLKKHLQNYLKTGEIARVGRNAYCVKGNLIDYDFVYSDSSIQISEILNKNYYDLDFRITELYQLNSFLNHQIAHNVIYVFVEKDLCTSVFEQLKCDYKGVVLIEPSTSDFFNYRKDNMVVVKKLLTESPKGEKEKWNTNLEKLLVDIFAEELLKETFSESEYPTIYETCFQSYVINENQMFRYARRRKIADRIKQFLEEETDVKLRVE